MNRIYKAAFTFIFLLGTMAVNAQELSLEEIFASNTLNAKGVYGIEWMKDGKFYSALVNNDVVKFDTKSGNRVATLLDGDDVHVAGDTLKIDQYQFAADESKLLIATQSTKIYRHSKKAVYYTYDIQSKQLTALDGDSKVMHATFSPDGSKVAFVKENDLYFKALEDGKITRITEDGAINQIINGSSDWVYEEEFGFTKAFFWSPDSDKIAYYRFDESNVKEYNMPVWGALYPEDYRFKYPKAGEENAKVNIYCYTISKSKKVEVELPDDRAYVARLGWAEEGDKMTVAVLNRFQNELKFYLAYPHSGISKIVFLERSETYVDINYNDKFIFLDESTFLRTSESDGYKHIYLMNVKGQVERQITKGSFVVKNILGYDKKKKLIYFTSTENSSLEEQLYTVDVKGKNKTQISQGEGVHNINFSKDLQFYIDHYGSLNRPQQVSLHESTGKRIKLLEGNKAVEAEMQKFDLGRKEIVSIPIFDSLSLNAYVIKPKDFDPAKEYPLWMYVYGGPGSQLVRKRWGGAPEAWFHYLADQGYIVACVDNRGTGSRGRAFKHATYGQMGKLEVEDQIAAAKYFGNLDYIDADRIGIWGWSYGGYMSSLSLFVGSDVFKAAIAVAPVTSWRYYDTVYTERFLKTPQANPEGYDNWSPISHVDKLKGKFLLIHGTGDDNVHFQNSVMLEDLLIKNGKQFRSFYYPNKDHAIRGQKTQLHLYTMMSEFIIENL